MLTFWEPNKVFIKAEMKPSINKKIVMLGLLLLYQLPEQGLGSYLSTCKSFRLTKTEPRLSSKINYSRETEFLIRMFCDQPCSCCNSKPATNPLGSIWQRKWISRFSSTTVGQIQSTFVNPRKGFDRDYEKSSGVSPIKFRHEIDLYGCKSGVG